MFGNKIETIDKDTFEVLSKLILHGLDLNRLKIVDLTNPTINDNSINNRVYSSSIYQVFFYYVVCVKYIL